MQVSLGQADVELTLLEVCEYGKASLCLVSSYSPKPLGPHVLWRFLFLLGIHPSASRILALSLKLQ